MQKQPENLVIESREHFIKHSELHPLILKCLERQQEPLKKSPQLTMNQFSESNNERKSPGRFKPFQFRVFPHQSSISISSSVVIEHKFLIFFSLPTAIHSKVKKVYPAPFPTSRKENCTRARLTENRV